MINIGVSSCLLGKKVRYNGGHKQNCYITEILSKHFKCVPYCPEVRAGFGIPREMVELQRHKNCIQIRGRESDKNLTSKIKKSCGKYISGSIINSLSGYIFKEKSPSCGLKKVAIRQENGKIIRNGIGLFTAMIEEQFPLLPLVQADDFTDLGVRESFIEQVFAYRRLQQLYQKNASYHIIKHFHSIHRLQLMARSKNKLAGLDELLKLTKKHSPINLRDEYAFQFMKVMKIKSSISKNVMVMNYILKTFQKSIDDNERTAIVSLIDDYQNEQTPLIVPKTLLKYYTDKFKIVELSNQVYLNQNPQELMLCYHG